MRLTTLAAALGAADTAAFLAARPALFREAPGRAGGSVVFLAAWAGLAVSAAQDERHTGRRTAGLAWTVAAANGAMLAVHLRHHIASPRVFAGAALSGVALVSALSRA